MADDTPHPVALESVSPAVATQLVDSLPVTTQTQPVQPMQHVQPLPLQTQLPPTTTYQQDLVVLGQRKINQVWEYTQAFIAISVVLANLVAGTIFAINRVPSGDYPFVLSSSLFLVIGFYFSRTNHSAIGGIGPKPADTYSGR